MPRTTFPSPRTANVASADPSCPIRAWQWAVAIALALVAVVRVAVAEPQIEDRAITNWSVDGGAGQSSGGAFELRGVIGQADADPLQPSSGGAFGLTGGVLGSLPPSGPLDEAIFVDGFESP